MNNTKQNMESTKKYTMCLLQDGFMPEVLSLIKEELELDYIPHQEDLIKILDKKECICTDENPNTTNSEKGDGVFICNSCEREWEIDREWINYESGDSNDGYFQETYDLI